MSPCNITVFQHNAGTPTYPMSTNFELPVPGFGDQPPLTGERCLQQTSQIAEMESQDIIQVHHLRQRNTGYGRHHRSLKWTSNMADMFTWNMSHRYNQCRV